MNGTPRGRRKGKEKRQRTEGGVEGGRKVGKWEVALPLDSNLCVQCLEGSMPMTVK